MEDSHQSSKWEKQREDLQYWDEYFYVDVDVLQRLKLVGFPGYTRKSKTAKWLLDEDNLLDRGAFVIRQMAGRECLIENLCIYTLENPGLYS